ncbi:hypothetical protein Leryth_000765 [Lithospermum erythrorhizon]|nr:hypothetical protein Leryth_000765 [Lithospermum erythrorhizon]
MKIHWLTRIPYSVVALFCTDSHSMGNDMLRPQQSVTFNNTLVSSQNRFQVGIYCPGDSRSCYLSIWFSQISTVYPVWIANRDKPVNETSGFLRIGDDGNLVLVDETQAIFWSTNISNLSSRSTVAQLLDTGNLVLWDNIGGNILWESFDHPSHVLIAGMKLGLDLRSGLDRSLTSWRSSEDLSPGEYKFSVEIVQDIPQAIMWKGTSKHFRTGTWNGKDLGGLVLGEDLPMSQELVVNQEEVFYRFQNKDNSSWIMLTMDYSGEGRYLQYDVNSDDLRLLRAVPQDDCGIYGFCGPNSICTISDARVCSCFDGYSPKNSEEWDIRIWSGGCARTTPFNCSQGDGFAEIPGLKMPELLSIWVNDIMSLEECKAECLNNCTCTAYTNKLITGGGRGCLLWFGDLVDVRKLSEFGDQKLYLRVLASELELGTKKKNRIVLIVLTTSASILLLSISLLIIWKWRSLRKDNKLNCLTNLSYVIYSFNISIIVKS